MEDIVSPLKAIRAFCIDCCGGSASDVRDCTATSCPLKAFRFGKNPYRKKRELSDEQKKAMRVRLEDARKQRSVK